MGKRSRITDESPAGLREAVFVYLDYSDTLRGVEG
jgi:hypothetical protein